MVVNFGGILPTMSPKLWKNVAQHKIHVFIWLLFNKKLFIKENLAIWREVTDQTCLLRYEPESIHLFFDCIIAKQPSSEFADTLDCNLWCEPESIHLFFD
jgi:hypothetical protein